MGTVLAAKLTEGYQRGRSSLLNSLHMSPIVPIVFTSLKLKSWLGHLNPDPIGLQYIPTSHDSRPTTHFRLAFPSAAPSQSLLRDRDITQGLQQRARQGEQHRLLQVRLNHKTGLQKKARL